MIIKRESAPVGGGVKNFTNRSLTENESGANPVKKGHRK